MLDRRWLQHAALIGVVTVLIGFAAYALMYGPGGPYHQIQQAQTSQATTNPKAAAIDSDRPISGSGPNSAAQNQKSCDSNIDCAQKDLLIQERMADAAENQFWVTAVESVFLFVTIITAGVAIAVAFGANQIARESAEHQLRAYIAVSKPVWQLVQRSENKPVTGYNFCIRWKNCGATPARRCQGRSNSLAFDGPMPEDFTFPDRKTQRVTIGSHLGPGQETELTVGVSLADVAAASQGKKHIYVWSWIEYSDVFDQSPRRRTEVCIELLVPKDMGAPTPSIMGRFNGADEDCYRKPQT